MSERTDRKGNLITQEEEKLRESGGQMYVEHEGKWEPLDYERDYHPGRGSVKEDADHIWSVPPKGRRRHDKRA